eukprot:TRINITY_DN38_c0_g2_i4.p1 TRINITY_DN38_c0_g2~~TRINITY_DN38_c0_g2_i4.p1  ORF type:complete len:373 (-),score=24.95 TRINITY_DN38_c0_g2_i4:184-1302(-)
MNSQCRLLEIGKYIFVPGSVRQRGICALRLDSNSFYRKSGRCPRIVHSLVQLTFSFAYGSTGKFIEKQHVSEKALYIDCGLAIRKGDVITCILQPEAEINVAFLVNSNIVVQRTMEFEPNSMYQAVASARMANVSAIQIDDATRQDILDSFNEAAESEVELDTIRLDVKKRVSPSDCTTQHDLLMPSALHVDWKRIFQQRSQLSDNPHAIMALLQYIGLGKLPEQPRYEVGYMVEAIHYDFWYRRSKVYLQELDSRTSTASTLDSLSTEVHVIYIINPTAGERTIVWDHGAFVHATEGHLLQSLSVPFLRRVLKCRRLITTEATQHRACMLHDKCDKGERCRSIHVNSFDDFIEVFNWELRKVRNVGPYSKW